MWNDIINQAQAVRELRAIAEYDSSPQSILLHGMYGHGKTALARLTAQSRGFYAYYPVPPRHISDVRGFGNAVIIDEIHLARRPEEYYGLMGQNRLFIFCTTDPGKVATPLRSRCISIGLIAYTELDITEIIMTTMHRWGTSIDHDKAFQLAMRSHHNPRIGLTLADRVYRLIRMDSRLFSLDNILEELDNLRIDCQGLDDRHRAYLVLLTEYKRPTGLRTICAALGLDEDTILHEIEPILLRTGRISITPRGRLIIKEEQ